MNNEKHNRLKVELTVTYNKPVTSKRMEYLLQEIQELVENRILEDSKLTNEIGNVLIGNPFGQPFEICI